MKFSICLIVLCVLGLSIACKKSSDELVDQDELRLKTISSVASSNVRILLKNLPSRDALDTPEDPDALVRSILEAANRGVDVDLVVDSAPLSGYFYENLVLAGGQVYFHEGSAINSFFDLGDELVVVDSQDYFVFHEQDDYPRVLNDGESRQKALEDILGSIQYSIDE